mmetsp:Transcript_6965/g.12696  ORF Transcript_6965/g.12696 Transcript_6965/m.12696 type:complete len:194 (-) Transcript_6965:27-608(-)
METYKVTHVPWYKFWANPVEYEYPPATSERAYIPLKQKFFYAYYPTEVQDNPVACNRLQQQVYGRYIEEVNFVVYRHWRCCGVLKTIFTLGAAACLAFAILSLVAVQQLKPGTAVFSFLFWLFGVLLFAILVRLTIHFTLRAIAKNQVSLDAIYRTRYLGTFSSSQIYVQVGPSCLWLEFGIASRLQYEPPIV